MCRPNFPVALEDLAASITFHDLNPGDQLAIDDVMIRTARLNHPAEVSVTEWKTKAGER